MLAIGSCDHNIEAVATTTRAATYRFLLNSDRTLLARGQISSTANRVDAHTNRRVGPAPVSMSATLLPATDNAPFGEKNEQEP